MRAKRFREGCRSVLAVALSVLLCTTVTTSPALAAEAAQANQVQASQDGQGDDAGDASIETNASGGQEGADQDAAGQTQQETAPASGADGDGDASAAHSNGTALGASGAKDDEGGASDADDAGQAADVQADPGNEAAADSAQPLAAASNDEPIIVESGTKSVTLDGRTINQQDGDAAAIQVCKGATLELTIKGTNELYGGEIQPAIFVEDGGTLIVRGSGTLKAVGGLDAPAIGGDAIDRNCGTIELWQTGTLDLMAGGDGAPALGNVGRDAADTGKVAIYDGTVNLSSPDASADIAAKEIVMGGGSVSFSQKVPQGMKLPGGGENAARVELRRLPAGVDLTKATFSPSLGVSLVSDPQQAAGSMRTSWFNVAGFGAPTNGGSVVVFAPVSKLQPNALITMTANGVEYSGSLIGSASDGFTLTLAENQVVNNPRIDISRVASDKSVQFATTSAGDRQYSTDSGATWTGYTGTPVLTGTDDWLAAPRDGARVIIQSGSHSLRLQNYRSNLERSYDPSACGLVVKNGAQATVTMIGSNEILSAYNRAIRLEGSAVLTLNGKGSLAIRGADLSIEGDPTSVLNVSGPQLKYSSGGFQDGTSGGIHVGTLNITNAAVDFKVPGSTKSVNGIAAYRDMTISDSTVNVEAQHFSPCIIAGTELQKVDDKTTKRGTLTINNSTVTAVGAGYSAAIGASLKLDCGAIVINGGTITAKAANGSSAAGIGSAGTHSCDGVTITGGTVVATGTQYAPGIGGENCGPVKISGGTVTGTAGYVGLGSLRAGISQKSGSPTITGGSVKSIDSRGAESTLKSSNAKARTANVAAFASVSGDAAEAGVAAGEAGADAAEAGDQGAGQQALFVNEDGEPLVSLVIAGLPKSTPVADFALKILDTQLVDDPEGGSSYGVRDVDTDEDGCLHFWLTNEEAVGKLVLATCGGQVYQGATSMTDEGGWRVDLQPVDADVDADVFYEGHTFEHGWTFEDEGVPWATDGMACGSADGSALTAVRVTTPLPGVEVVSSVDCGSGWMADEVSGGISGTMEEPIQGLKLSLSGDAASAYHIYYRVQVEGVGWTAWASDGAPAGTTGADAAVLAFQVMLVPAGEQFVPTGDPSDISQAYVDYTAEPPAEDNPADVNEPVVKPLPQQGSLASTGDALEVPAAVSGALCVAALALAGLAVGLGARRRHR